MEQPNNQQTAMRLLEEGAFLIFLDVPEGTEFGIDMKSWNTGDKFRGVKMVPPGIHFIFFSAVSNAGDISPRTGFFKYFRKSEVVVRKWDIKNECISKEVVSEEDIIGLKDNLRELDSFLGPYPFDIHSKWLCLTTYITESMIEQLIPLSGYIQSALELESCTDADRPRGKPTSNSEISVNSDPRRLRLTDELEDKLLPKLKPKIGTDLRYTPFPHKNYPEGATPSQITQHSLDSSYVLNLMISSYSNNSDILGEMQICYICFLVGHSLEAFEQWKKLFSLFCSCETAITKYRKLYDAFISLIEMQIKEIPEDFLADIVSNYNFVYMKLGQLFRAIQESDVDGELKMKTARLKKSLMEQFMWDFEYLDAEDEAPVIVEI
ncbi:unnamed protein product [Phaedon cochleariae]|uniref:Protein AAR2 homolog n=1 Tax=Phaedon cochleariae TaxID=80249 RepID=A0A9P0DMA7_PHACE|nr:unnamed protein product [Phaedon cochleariae]